MRTAVIVRTSREISNCLYLSHRDQEGNNNYHNRMADASKLALKGSSKVVCDYFEFAINNILFQRGIYPSEDFQTVRKYDLPLLIAIDEDIKSYIEKFLTQIKKWVYGTKLQKFILVIIDKLTGDPVERWEFNIQIFEDDDNMSNDNNNEHLNGNTNGKSKDLIKKEIQAIIRQITSSTTYLPILDGEFTFNILVYTDHNTNQIPIEWCDTKDQSLSGEFESVDFSSFETNLHSVGTKVSYKIDN